MKAKLLYYKRAFTLVELIVVMIVMTILATLTAIAYRGIADDLRMSSAVNTVVAALDNARATAIKKNRYVLTVFRPRLDRGGTEQIIDITLASWDGDSSSMRTETYSGYSVWTYDRFVPVDGVQVRSIPAGVNVAGPGYSSGDDEEWWLTTYLPSNLVNPNSEAFGCLVGVLYNPEGKVVTRNSETGSDRIWVDFNSDGEQFIDSSTSVGWLNSDDVSSPWNNAIPFYGVEYFKLKDPAGEPLISLTSILSVFNEEEFRLSVDTTNTSFQDEDYRYYKYSEYIDANADRIQFDRYSGVPMQ